MDATIGPIIGIIAFEWMATGIGLNAVSLISTCPGPLTALKTARNHANGLHYVATGVTGFYEVSGGTSRDEKVS